MLEDDRVLTPSEAQAYYDRFGKKQDSQGFYEDPAMDRLVANSAFQDGREVFEFGCGTGKFAARLLQAYLPASATYLGSDISPVMIGLATQRIEKYSDRAKVLQSDGTMCFPLPNHSVDRVVSSYVLDLLSDNDIRIFFSEAHRTLRPGGRLCLASLTYGITLWSRIVSSLWSAVFRIRPSIVGGCRPVHLDAYVDRKHWEIVHREVLTPFGVPSEVLVLISRTTPETDNAVDAPTTIG